MKLSRRELFKTNPKSILSRFTASDNNIGYKIQPADVVDTNCDIALVITTNGIVPYVHLHLESWRRNYPNVKILVYNYNDNSSDILEQLCKQYKVSYCQKKNNINVNFKLIADCLKWSKYNNCKVLVKFSHDYIPLFNWLPEFNTVRENEYFPTYTSSRVPSITYDIKCIAFHVETWLNQCIENINEGQPDITMASLINHAGRVWKREKRISNVDKAINEWSLANALMPPKYPHILSNNSCDPIEYCRALIQFGFIYRLEDWYNNG